MLLPMTVWRRCLPACRDDPLLADKSHLWDVPEPPQPADIDQDMDL
jgi:hypothetical protein